MHPEIKAENSDRRNPEHVRLLPEHLKISATVGRHSITKPGIIPRVRSIAMIVVWCGSASIGLNDFGIL